MAVRIRQNIDFDWRFLLGDSSDAQRIGFDDSDWRLLDVPHDWSIEGEYRRDHPGGGKIAYLPTGVAWYRKTIEIPSEWLQRQVTLQFDGVFMNSTVWLNGHLVGGRPYGFISFACDLTPRLCPGENVISVRVDNSEQPAARWYTGSGIYGHAHLIVTNPVHVAQWGTCVQTPVANNDTAEVAIFTEAVNNSDSDADVRLVSRVMSPEGSMVGEEECVFILVGHSSYVAKQRIVLANPLLWSPDTPALYTLVSLLYRDGKLVDTYETPFGIRTIRWDADAGFLLNGHSLKLKGVCEHHDGGPVGAAIPDALIARRLQQLKEMGCNAIRTAHNPRTPIFYDLCDRMGLLVMNELFDGWHKKADADYGARFFTDWWQQDVQDCVRRDRNHPSIIIWSIGNETGKHDEHDITGFIHSLDPTRPTTGGTVFTGVDVSGFNGPAGKPGTLETFHDSNPNRPLVVTEEPHTLQTRGFYRTATWWRDPDMPHFTIPSYAESEVFSGGQPRNNSSYDNSAVRMNARTGWKRTSTIPWICGEFRWTGFDYLGEAEYCGGAWPERAWNYGIIDLAGLPKDHYFLYQSFWSATPMVHILPHWTHPGLGATELPVVAYSNCDEVELFVNRRSLGRQKRGELMDFVWHTPYEPGELEAVAYQGGCPVASKGYRTAGAPERLILTVDNPDLRADRLDMSLLTFNIADRHGTHVPWADSRVDFKLAGPALLLGYENGDPYDTTPHRIGWRKAFYGLGRGFYQATSQVGPVEVTAFSILGLSEFANETSVAMAIGRVSLRGTLTKVVWEIRYTTDGSEPDAGSLLYTQPFTISDSAHIRALLLRDGQPWLTTEGHFTRRVSGGAERQIHS